ncbi:MAG: DUF3795 domain-containing protein [Deltaproteobacteria bacterium]|nr:DUF3795 domain-containing protein [Deltaproteobacteria bacterium]
MSVKISSPPENAHIAPCGLFCTNCGKFKKGKCLGCQIEAGFERCAIRLCCISKEIATCAECDAFRAPRDFRECKKIDNWVAKIFALIFKSDRPGALALLRDQGIEAYLTKKRASGKI